MPNQDSGGLIIQDGGRVPVASAVTIGAGDYVTNYVQGSSGGLDLGSSGTLTVNGNVNIVFQNWPRGSSGPVWGLRWQGDHVSDLNTLRSSGKLTWDDSGMGPFGQGRASICRDATYTYVGFLNGCPKGALITVY